jgi:hypothetical protein
VSIFYTNITLIHAVTFKSRCVQCSWLCRRCFKIITHVKYVCTISWISSYRGIQPCWKIRMKKMSSCIHIHLRQINKKRLCIITLISPFSVPQKIISLAAYMLVILLPADILPNFFGTPLNQICLRSLFQFNQLIFHC